MFSFGEKIYMNQILTFPQKRFTRDIV
uniref:Uncharacterized protein n=1 Tax=Anguilla anguilla TaxID=7936 RepID=A0A0E9PP64_ANGAN